jgi:hypothetical protein
MEKLDGAFAVTSFSWSPGPLSIISKHIGGIDGQFGIFGYTSLHIPAKIGSEWLK